MERDDLIEMIYDLFSQACRRDFSVVLNGNLKRAWHYDHMCISAYEQAQDFLVSVGRIKEEECTFQSNTPAGGEQ